VGREQEMIDKSMKRNNSAHRPAGSEEGRAAHRFQFRKKKSVKCGLRKKKVFNRKIKPYLTKP
jgi:hypothetical protein